MPDNSTNDIIETLTRYMDGELSTEEKLSTEQLLKTDVVLQERYQHLLAAKRAIKMQGLKERVHSIQQEYLLQTPIEKTGAPQRGKKISAFKTFMSIAAIVIVIIAGYSVYQYTSTTNEAVYNDNFINYSAPVSRGDAATSNLTELYNAGNYNGVVQNFEKENTKQPQDYFIAAQAYLHLNNSRAAIDNFKQIENINNKSGEQYFVEETDYYLMLAYIKNGDIDEAEKLLDKITANKQHLFYNKAKNINRTKLTILKWKQE